MNQWIAYAAASAASRRRKLTAAGLAGLTVIAPLAVRGDSHLPPSGAPSLSGDYVLTLINNCVQSGSSVSQTTVHASFDSAGGTVSYNGYNADGNPIVLTAISGSESFSNTKTTVTFGGTAYKAFYGPIKRGIAEYVSMIAIVAGDSGNCANQATLVHQ
jgi:hypothetical protein